MTAANAAWIARFTTGERVKFEIARAKSQHLTGPPQAAHVSPPARGFGLHPDTVRACPTARPPESRHCSSRYSFWDYSPSGARQATSDGRSTRRRTPPWWSPNPGRWPQFSGRSFSWDWSWCGGPPGESLSAKSCSHFDTSRTPGNVTTKSVPLPTSLCTSIRPRCASTIRRVVGSPSPLPPALVVKYGVNNFA